MKNSIFACLLAIVMMTACYTAETPSTDAPSVSAIVYFIRDYLFSGDSYGIVNAVLMRLGILREPVQWLTDPTDTTTYPPTTTTTWVLTGPEGTAPTTVWTTTTCPPTETN